MLVDKCSSKKRVTAFLIDLLIVLLTSLFFQYLIFLPIANNYFSYNEKQTNLVVEKIGSGLFVFVDNEYKVIVDFKDEEKEIISAYTSGYKLLNIKEYIYENGNSDEYIYYLNAFYSKFDIEKFNNLKKESNNFKDGEFISEIDESGRLKFCDDVFLEASNDIISYKEGIIDNLQANIYMIELVIEILSFLLPMIIFLYIVPLTNKYRSSIGKKIMRISVVNKFYVPCNMLLLTTRFLSFLLIEVLLSLFTIGIPLLISFILCIILKSGQCIHDLLSTTMVLDLDVFKPFEKIEEYNDFIKKEKEIKNQSLRRPYEN